MDLMKLLKAKSNHLTMAKTRTESVAGEVLSDLKLQFDNFLRDVSQLEEFRNSTGELLKFLCGLALLIGFLSS